jgi:hypothetical protein
MMIWGSIVTAIRPGRRVYDNLRKAMTFIVVVRVPIAGTSHSWPLVNRRPPASLQALTPQGGLGSAKPESQYR